MYEYLPGRDARILFFLKMIGIMIIILACLNYINLTTAKGLQRADPKIVEEAAKDIPTTNKAHHENVKAQLKLKPKQTELFDYIQDGRTYQKAEVATAINLKMNSTFSNLLTSLKKIGVIEFDRTTIRLTDEMFPFGPRGEQEELRIWSGVLRLFDFEVLRKA